MMWKLILTISWGLTPDGDFQVVAFTVDEAYPTAQTCEIDRTMLVEDWVLGQGALPPYFEVEGGCHYVPVE